MTDPAHGNHPNGPIILFDAACVLCSANARFVLERDKRQVFRLASIQSAAGQALCIEHGIDPDDPTSILVVEQGRARRNSDAVLTIFERLGFPWRLAMAFRLAPASMRDPVYGWIARNRYRWFGERQQCWVAPPAYRHRIL